MYPHLGQNVKYLMGETCNTASSSLILYFPGFTGYRGTVLILAFIDQARQVDQTCIPCIQSEGEAYLALVFIKKSKYDRFYSALCIDSSKTHLLSYTPRYRSGRSWLLHIA